MVKHEKEAKEIRKILESRNIMEFEDGSYLYVVLSPENERLMACAACNAGLVTAFEIEYDYEVSLDENLANLYEVYAGNI